MKRPKLTDQEQVTWLLCNGNGYGCLLTVELEGFLAAETCPCKGTGLLYPSLSKMCPTEECHNGILTVEDLPFQHAGTPHKLCRGRGRILAEVNLEDLLALARNEYLHKEMLRALADRCDNLTKEPPLSEELMEAAWVALLKGRPSRRRSALGENIVSLIPPTPWRW